MTRLILGLVFIALGVVTFFDGLRSFHVPKTNMEVVGAEHVELAIAVLVFVFGMALAASEIRLLASRRLPVRDAISLAPQYDHVLIIGFLITYVIALPLIGYTVSTALFLGASIYLLGYRNMRWLVVGSVATAAILTAIFPIALDMPLPGGILSQLFLR